MSIDKHTKKTRNFITYVCLKCIKNLMQIQFINNGTKTNPARK